MKALLPFLLVSVLVACNSAENKPQTTEATETHPTERTLPPTKQDNALVPNNTQTVEEDCDDKAKQPIEIKEETISLSGNTGCSLEEAH